MTRYYISTDYSRRRYGLAVMLLVHLGVGWLVLSGNARKGMELAAQPLQALLVQEVTIPPPPPKPIPPPKAPAEVVKPPPFVPTAAVAPSNAGLQIESAVEPPREPSKPAPEPVISTPVVAQAQEPHKVDMSLACPVQVPPQMPRRALLDGVQGVVTAQMKIEDGQVRDVVVTSGPRIFYEAVRSAMLQYKCSKVSGEVIATQSFNFKLQ
jgi:protein TonB